VAAGSPTGTSRSGRGRTAAQMRSMMVAVGIAPPAHMVTSAVDASRPLQVVRGGGEQPGTRAAHRLAERDRPVLGWQHSVARQHVEVALAHPARLIANALGPPPPHVISRAHERGMLVAAGALARLNGLRWHPGVMNVKLVPIEGPRRHIHDRWQNQRRRGRPEMKIATTVGWRWRAPSATKWRTCDLPIPGRPGDQRDLAVQRAHGASRSPTVNQTLAWCEGNSGTAGGQEWIRQSCRRARRWRSPRTGCAGSRRSPGRRCNRGSGATARESTARPGATGR
jgi:hypothetical protein